MSKRFKLIFLILLIFLVVFLELLAGDPSSTASQQKETSSLETVITDRET